MQFKKTFVYFIHINTAQDPNYAEPVDYGISNRDCEAEES